MRALVASPLGFLIGVSLGAVGGGGSILAVPALVYAAGLEPRQATSASLVIVGATALAGLPGQLRARQVRVAPGIAFALIGIAGSVAGTQVNEQIDPALLLLAFSALMVGAALAMSLNTRRTPTARGSGDTNPQGARDPSDARPEEGIARRLWVSPLSALKVAAAGTVVGFLTGMFGVGGGFVIVPALVLALGFAMPVAAGTSLLVIAVNSVIALSQRFEGQPLAWNAIIAFGIAAVPGVLVGTRLARAVEPRRLTAWFVALLLGVAAYTAVQSGITLASG